MSLTEHHLHQARVIDDFVTSTFAHGGDETDIVRRMIDYMPAFKGLLDSTTPTQMDELCQRFDGFYRFASIMENLAAGIATGDIEVPQASAPESQAGNVHTFLPRLTVNGAFMTAFLEATAPCFALGLVEERQQPCGFLALRPDESIPKTIMDQGFRFGHSLRGNAHCEVVHFAFEFYGFGTYHALVNPNHAIVQAVLDRMIEQKDYFFFAMDADQSVTAFRSDIGEEDLVGLKINHQRMMNSTTTAAQYEKALAQFTKNPNPPGTLLTWVCYENDQALDLINDRLEMTPGS